MPPASPGAPCGAGREISPPHPRLPSPRGRPLGSGYKAPLPEPRAQPAPPAGRALQLQEIPEALHHPGAARSPGCQGSPKESHMPAGRAARPRLPPLTPAPRRLQPGRAATSGRAGGPAGRPFPRPGPNGMRGSPGRGLFSAGRGAARPRCFLAFSWPPARQPGPSAARGVEGGSRGGEGGVGGKGGPPRSGLGLGPRPRPGRRPAAVRTCASRPRPSGGIINSAPGSGCGSRAPATCTPLLR